ncbi:MAG: insulinase family protein [Chitinophagaceae bacterium]|nr:insulinase family protein [Chitinophagaceae bacterium]
MINYSKFVLDNGLRVVVNEDNSTPLVVVNVLYDVGARDEDPDKTGFAHLFEHLMFGGSIHIPDYDSPLQIAGGENNAYTTNDITNYYCQLPAENIETAFWLESDRMLSLAFSPESLDVQKKVVSEEFKENYINQPYGDVWSLLREMTFKVHPYKWMTIGKDLSHIEKAKLKDVKDFFFKHYTPSNAILSVAGNVTTEQVKALAYKWFADIPAGPKYERHLPQEPDQTEKHFLEVKRKVPVDAFYKAWHGVAWNTPEYYSMDLLTDILGSGKSSRLFQSLVKEKKLFSNIDCYHLGSVDAGLVVIEGKLAKGVSFEDAEAGVDMELEKVKEEKLTEKDLEKLKNRVESALAFEDTSLKSRAADLAFFELRGDAGMINTVKDKYFAVTAEEIRAIGRKIFREENASVLWYRSEDASGLTSEAELETENERHD